MCTGRFFLLALSACLAAPAQPSQADQLLQIRRICVDKFAGDDPATVHAREVTIASMFALKRFTVTENCDRADAVLRGAVAEKEDQRTRAESDGGAIAVSSGSVHANRAGGSAGAVSTRGEEALFSSETRRQASVTLRLVNKDGDVLWAHTQDSLGAKSKLAISDAVDRAMKQLLKDIEKLTLSKPKPEGE